MRACVCVCVCIWHCSADLKGCGSCRQTTTILTAPATWLHTNVLVWHISLFSASPLINLPLCFLFLPLPIFPSLPPPLIYFHMTLFLSLCTLPPTLLFTLCGSDIAWSCWYNPPTTSATTNTDSATRDLKKGKEVDNTGVEQSSHVDLQANLSSLKTKAVNNDYFFISLIIKLVILSIKPISLMHYNTFWTHF